MGARGRREPDQTTHFVTATADGGVVSVTYTLNDTLGNHTVVPGVGVLLNNEMDDFAVEPGAANSYGLVQGESNAVRAGARALSSMTPTIVLENGRPRLALGSPGGAVIPTTVLQVYLNYCRRGEPLGEAVAARRFHHQHLPDRIELEQGVFPEDVKAALRAKGHTLYERASRYTEGMIGRVHASRSRRTARSRPPPTRAATARPAPRRMRRSDRLRSPFGATT